MFEKYKKIILAVLLVGIGLAVGGVLPHLIPEKEVVPVDTSVNHEKILFEILMIGAGNNEYDVIDQETGETVYTFETTLTTKDVVNYYETYEFRVK